MLTHSEFNELYKNLDLALSQKERHGAFIVINELIRKKDEIIAKLTPDHAKIIMELVEIDHVLDLKDIDFVELEDGKR